MESYGALLKQAREEKGLAFATIARETTIAQFYLEALEAEDKSAFPGEPYLVGFLKNYAIYLGLDADRILNLYRAKTIQEAPVPEGLIVHDPPKYKTPLIIGIAAAVVVILVVTLIVILSGRSADKEREEANRNLPKKYELTDKALQTRLYKGDQLIMSSEGQNVILTVAQTVENLVLETPAGRQYIELADEVELDIDNDKVADLIAYVSDIAPKDGDEKRGAEVRIMLRDANAAAVTETDETSIQDATEIVDQSKTVICEDTRAYPFTIVATFRGGCVFRYRTDSKETVEDYLASGEEVRMTASNKIRLWMSNGNTVKLQVVAGSKTIDLGVSKAGAVIVEDIKWIKDVDGKFKIVVVDVD